MDHEKKSLRQRKDVEKDSLARIEGDLIRCETRMLREERYSLRWNQILINLNSLKLKRQMLISRIADLRIESDKKGLLSAGDF